MVLWRGALFEAPSKDTREAILNGRVFLTLPCEMIDRILHLAGFGQCPHYHVSSTSTYSGIHPAEIPPRGGKSPFLEAPIEVRHQILTYLIHDKGNIVRPCMQKSTTSNKKNAGISFTCKLLTLNKKIAAELLLTLYEERTFVIDVFEGLERGGVEFLNAGCQPLQYKFGSHDTRFKRFENKNNKWGFSRLKHLIINIHPTSTDEIFNTHHVSLATYFMVLALCKLLERSNNKKEQICHIKVCFVKPKESSTEDAVGHQVTMKAERYWWNPDTDAPRETSIYGVPNVKLVLLPLSHLSNVQNVTIELPSSLNECKAITTWRDELEKPMKCRLPTLHLDDDFQYKMGAARDALEAFIFEKKYGGCPTELEPGHWMSDEDYNEEDFENPVDTEAEGKSTKRVASPDISVFEMSYMSPENRQAVLQATQEDGRKPPSPKVDAGEERSLNEYLDPNPQATPAVATGDWRRRKTDGPNSSPEPSTGYTGYAGQRKGKGKAKLIGLFQDLPASTPTCSGSWNILFNADGDGRSTYTASPSSPNYTDSQESSQERARGWDTNASGWDALHGTGRTLGTMFSSVIDEARPSSLDNHRGNTPKMSRFLLDNEPPTSGHHQPERAYPGSPLSGSDMAAGSAQNRTNEGHSSHLPRLSTHRTRRQRYLPPNLSFQDDTASTGNSSNISSGLSLRYPLLNNTSATAGSHNMSTVQRLHPYAISTLNVSQTQSSYVPTSGNYVDRLLDSSDDSDAVRDDSGTEESLP